ncbi:unnamed protein product, partial [Symbiodinium natans]
SFLTMAFNPDGERTSASSARGLELPPKPADPPADGMFAWFKSENAGSVWPSSVGDFVGRCSLNSVFRTVSAGHGADRPVTSIRGYSWSGFTFGDVIPVTHTVCSVTRYHIWPNSKKRQRILQSEKSSNWLHGHWKGNTGVVFYNGWLTPDSRNKNVEDWVVLCGTNDAQRAVDGNKTNIATGSGKKFSKTIPMYVNHGYDERSDFDVMEVITWDRGLSEEEMRATVDYLNWKLRVGAVLEVSEHLSTELQHNFDSFGTQLLDNVQSQKFDVTLANGYKAELTGWTHTRDYARGFIRTLSGPATAVVNGLSPAAQYIYQIYMVHEKSNWEGEAKISVNHGVEARVHQNEVNEARFAGVATATPQGQLHLEFQKISPHVHLSGIAIAKVGSPTRISKPADPPSQGMFAWFKSEHAGTVWPSSVGGFEGRSSRNSVFRTVSAGYGADRPVTSIEGTASSGFTFGDVLPPAHTVCSITRYSNGDHRGRILQSSKSYNWLHGHWKGRTGVAFYNGWVTSNSRNKDMRDWVVLCGTNDAQRVFDESSTNIATGSGKKFSQTIPMYVNHGHDERSAFAVMEVITWDRALSKDEMLATVDYLNWKLRAGAVLEVSEHLAPESESNFDSFGNQLLDKVESQTFEATLANGYKTELTGWTHTRDYARGFIRNLNGPATAVVKGLSPAAQYIYQVYMVHEKSNWEGECRVSVNHGIEARATGNFRNAAKVSGVAVATPRGEINLEFQRVSPHVQLSGIAVAAVASSTSLLQEEGLP